MVFDDQQNTQFFMGILIVTNNFEVVLRSLVKLEESRKFIFLVSELFAGSCEHDIAFSLNDYLNQSFVIRN